MKNKNIKPLIVFVVAFLCVINVFPQSLNVEEPPKVVQDINYFLYKPFDPNSKVIVLQEKSKIKLFDNLPILDGATALYPVYSAFVRAVYPEKPPQGYAYEIPVAAIGGKEPLDKLIIRCTQTPMAYENLINGIVDIIFCAEPSKEQSAKAAERGINFNFIPIGIDSFVFFVNKNNPVNNLTSDQIRAIYSGKITNWFSFNGIDEPIIAYQRPQNSGSQTILESVIMKDTKIMEPLIENVIGGMGGIIEQVATYKNYVNAIGYSFLFFTTEMVNNNEIKLVSIDNIYPSRETIQKNEYIFTGPFYAITRGNHTENMGKFLDWILSSQGQYLVEKTGYVPINNNYEKLSMSNNKIK
jgi:phosphate transport system substrate-binding protein